VALYRAAQTCIAPSGNPTDTVVIEIGDEKIVDVVMDVDKDAPGGVKIAGIVEKAAGYSLLDGHPAPSQGLEPQQP
jgi:hypothetical protein